MYSRAAADTELTPSQLMSPASEMGSSFHDDPQCVPEPTLPADFREEELAYHQMEESVESLSPSVERCEERMFQDPKDTIKSGVPGVVERFVDKIADDGSSTTLDSSDPETYRTADESFDRPADDLAAAQAEQLSPESKTRWSYRSMSVEESNVGVIVQDDIDHLNINTEHSETNVEEVDVLHSDQSVTHEDVLQQRVITHHEHSSSPEETKNVEDNDSDEVEPMTESAYVVGEDTDSDSEQEYPEEDLPEDCDPQGMPP